MTKTPNNHIVELSEREHILKRPSMYIGAVDPTTIQEYVLADKKIELQSISYIPGFIKIINEIIDNSVDIAIKTNFKCNQIKVTIAEDYIEVVDNGIGIPVVESNGKYMPELAWGRARAGSNFSDDANRTQIGMNGIGSFATNCFSKKFIGTSDDGTNRCVCVFTDNALNCKTKVSPSSGKTGVTVKFYPDLEKFGLKSIDETHVSLIKQRLLNLAISYPAIRFTFNKKQITTNSFRKYVTLFQSVPVLYEGKNYSFAILPNDSDEFRQFSYVNGLRIYEGTHTDVIINNIVSRIKAKLERKYKNIKPADIKNKLFFIAFLKDVKNLKFSSQAKEKITNSVSEINNYFGEIPYDVICKKILGTPKIIDPITEIYRIKEEFKRRQELKQLDKPKKIRNENYIPSIGTQKYLMITEGFSACNAILPVLGRQECAYYTLKGKPLNAYASSQKKFTENKELTGLFQVIKNGVEIEDLPDKEFYELEIDGKVYIASINDEIQINGNWIKVSDLIRSDSSKSGHSVKSGEVIESPVEKSKISTKKIKPSLDGDW